MQHPRLPQAATMNWTKSPEFHRPWPLKPGDRSLHTTRGRPRQWLRNKVPGSPVHRHNQYAGSRMNREDFNSVSISAFSQPFPPAITKRWRLRTGSGRLMYARTRVATFFLGSREPTNKIKSSGTPYFSRTRFFSSGLHGTKMSFAAECVTVIFSALERKISEQFIFAKLGDRNNMIGIGNSIFRAVITAFSGRLCVIVR